MRAGRVARPAHPARLRPGGESGRGEEIVELGDVPAGHPRGERAAAKRGLAPGAEGTPCLEPAGPVAQCPYGRERPGPREAVDRAAVEVPAAQTDLESC